MPLTIRTTGCCGMREIDNLSHPLTALDAIKNVFKHFETFDFSQPYVGNTANTVTLPALMMFSGVTKRVKRDHASNRPDDYGQAFADFIRDNDLGRIARGAEGVNGPGGNTLRAWIWTPDPKACKEWWKTNMYVPPPPPPTPMKAEDVVKKTRTRLTIPRPTDMEGLG